LSDPDVTLKSKLNSASGGSHVWRRRHFIGDRLDPEPILDALLPRRITTAA
jgi:hypothetical protein